MAFKSAMVICWFYKKPCDVNFVGMMSLALVKEQLKSLLFLSVFCGLTGCFTVVLLHAFLALPQRHISFGSLMFKCWCQTFSPKLGLCGKSLSQR